METQSSQIDPKTREDNSCDGENRENKNSPLCCFKAPNFPIGIQTAEEEMSEIDKRKTQKLKLQNKGSGLVFRGWGHFGLVCLSVSHSMIF